MQYVAGIAIVYARTMRTNNGEIQNFQTNNVCTCYTKCTRWAIRFKFQANRYQYAFPIDILIVQFILLCYNALSLKRFRKQFRLTVINNLKPTFMLPFADVWTIQINLYIKTAPAVVRETLTWIRNVCSSIRIYPLY